MVVIFGTIDDGVLYQYNRLYFLLAKDDLGIVYQAVLSLADDCHRLCLFLGIPKSKIDAIKQSYPAHVHEWLIEGLSEWLRSNHNTDKYGQPSWRTLIKCIGNIDCELARSLAKEHEGEFMTVLPVFND